MTPTELCRIMPCTLSSAQRFAAPLTQAMQRFGIDTPARQAAFLAQVAHESGCLQYVRELASGAAYEGRADLGNTQPGDGVRYRGRGLLQTTGRANYAELRPALLLAGYDAVPDFEADPERLEEPHWAAASAGHYWRSRGLNRYADSGDFTTLTRRINGGTNGLKDRQALWARAREVLLA